MEGNGHTPKYGFVIDHRKCIGCHACTVACKSENAVPVGSFRTWVKYVEKGRFPDVRRHFTVLRCNHCDAAPCVTICPVNALHKRPDAIVDLDRDQCIGCRGCMQACPYDALYLNEDTGVAEKCHYCAHRTELGLEPACVVVCPERAIVAGDVSDAESPISQLIATQSVTQRKLEKGTKPRVWYVDALPESLAPEKSNELTTFLWSDRRVQPPPIPPDMAPPDDIVTTLNTEHPPVWGWHIWWYLLTKNVSAGLMMVAPCLASLGVARGISDGIAPEVLSLVFLGITLFLLVHDLGRPERFLKILLTPNTNSWLVKGGWVLTAFGLCTVAAAGARLLGAPAAADALRLACVPLAVFASGYSAFLFRQCRGRDLWLGRTLFLDLTSRAGLIGVAWASILPVEASGATVGPGRMWTMVMAALVLVLMLVEGRFLPATEHARRAHAVMSTQYDKGHLSVYLVLAGACVAALLGPEGGVLGLAVLLIGLFLRERAWIRAGQAIPIS